MPKWTESPARETSIAVLIFDRFSNLCLANCIEPLRAANSFARNPAYLWQFASLDGGPVRSSSGMSVTPDSPLEDLPRVDLLMILSSYDHLRHDSPRTRRALRRAAGRAKQVAGFDSAPWLMASAGLLQGRRATLHTELYTAFSERFLDVTLLDDPVVEDGDRITCAGAQAAFDLSRRFVVRDLGQAAGVDLDALFLTGRPQHTSARAMPGDAMVGRAIALMRSSLDTPRPLSEIAAQLGVTQRTLARRCQAALGTSPGTLYRHLRLSAARQMVEGGMLPVSEIALLSGYEDPAALTRAFRRRFCTTPQALRREISA
ncbi:helix-turn-helix domain-containing protein [Mesobacterium sp. TK19101]|uniref:Helix-turn-helix domain-containing protein n=1 Tax=Mesobacterium hydrothermale TaxID=3111907 RepID=A0ABU6HDP7_9RHOB|nr:helix-turn-helix domain-containing protein [Mesobacterium sp. TK19101]MEC3860583.1 helix-turn-helix domain-containing protein [Mesobacterium sp. TK19101]